MGLDGFVPGITTNLGSPLARRNIETVVESPSSTTSGRGVDSPSLKRRFEMALSLGSNDGEENEEEEGVLSEEDGENDDDQQSDDVSELTEGHRSASSSVCSEAPQHWNTNCSNNMPTILTPLVNDAKLSIELGKATCAMFNKFRNPSLRICVPQLSDVSLMEVRPWVKPR